MSFARTAVRRLLPGHLARAYDGYRRWKSMRRNRRMTTEEVFTGIYSDNRWGGPPGSFCSGDGSHDAAIVSPYIALMTAELRRIGATRKTVVDLGCGDFAVGRQLSADCGRYIGVDIVKALIERNRAAFAGPQISFVHADIIADALPAGDVCFVRQVLQHLSNAQIAQALPKLQKVRWCYLTEHHPSAARLRRPNVDKPAGDDTRLAAGSGVFLDEAPFNIAAVGYRLLLEVPATRSGRGADPGIIRTYLIDNAAARAAQP